MAFNATEITPQTRLAIAKLNGQFAREAARGTTAVLNNSKLTAAQKQSQLTRIVTELVQRQAIYDTIAFQAYAASRNKTATMLGKMPSKAMVSSLSTNITQKTVKSAQKRLTDSIKEGMTDSQIITQMQLIIESTGAQRTNIAMSDILNADLKVSGMNAEFSEQPNPRTILVPSSSGCDFCKISAVRNEAMENTFHKGCTCTPTTVFSDQEVSTPELTEGAEKLAAATERMREQGIAETNANTMATLREIEAEKKAAKKPSE